MTVFEWLQRGQMILTAAGVPLPQLDTEVLLMDLLGVDRSWLHAHPEQELTDEQLAKLNAQIERRTKHEPLAYIRGKQEFYGRDFYVSPDTLTPRPETEMMIEMVLSSEFIAHSKGPAAFLDIGTGSGCIIITLALELALSQNLRLRTQNFIGLDVSQKALETAEKNAQNLKAEVTLQYFDLTKDSLSELRTQNSELVVLANLPYVPNDFHINLAASHEPPFAIFGGDDGLDYYRLLFQQLAQSQNSEPRTRNCTIFTESLPPQHEQLAEIAKSHGFVLQKTQDFIQQFTLFI